MMQTWSNTKQITTEPYDANFITIVPIEEDSKAPHLLHSFCLYRHDRTLNWTQHSLVSRRFASQHDPLGFELKQNTISGIRVHLPSVIVN